MRRDAVDVGAVVNDGERGEDERVEEHLLFVLLRVKNDRLF